MTVEKVFEAWEHNCMCGNGESLPSDCPGPPDKAKILKVKEWLKDTKQPIDIYPFSDPEMWDWYVETYA